jgi:phosphoribosylformylglycinamidine cyclo-ligase
MTDHTYAAAGVSLDAADAIVDRLRGAVLSTDRTGVMEAHGGFAGLFALSGQRDPVLVAATDGVGTKLVLQRAAGRLRDAGVDCVAMCVNDVLCTGAQPLFFLDYVSCGRLDPERIAGFVDGVADGCRQAGCALLGGETAEHPGVQGPDEMDAAGFCVGIIERDSIVDGRRVSAGDVLVGLASSGLHSNGFSLVRRVLEASGLTPDDAPGDLLAPTAIYATEVAALREALDVRAMAHITGGGLPSNLPRVLPDGLGAVVDLGAFERPPLFHWLAGLGVAEDELRRVFNCGIGFVAVVRRDHARHALELLGRLGRGAYEIGVVERGTGVRFAA